MKRICPPGPYAWISVNPTAVSTYNTSCELKRTVLVDPRTICSDDPMTSPVEVITPDPSVEMAPESLETPELFKLEKLLFTAELEIVNPGEKVVSDAPIDMVIVPRH